jgi:hypothetical protein
MPEINSAEWWAEHGVADDVRAARPYVRWTTADPEPVREAYAGLSEGQQKTLLRWAGQSDGLVIYRHSFERVPAGELRYVYPEIRPDQPVQTQTIWHYHGQPTPERPRHPSTGNPLRAEHVHAPESMTLHIARDRDPDDHCGVNSDQVHPHRGLAKYLFPPRATVPVPWLHSHRDEYWTRVHLRVFPGVDERGEVVRAEMTDEKREQLEAAFAAWFEQHAGNRHRDSDPTRVLEDGRELDDYDLHEHSVRTKRGGEQLAKRIDVHPLVWDHGGFDDAERVFFGIEGCIKADAILSALLQARQPPAVFSVPSVSLWDATYPTIVDEGDDDEIWVPADENEDEAGGKERPPEFTSYEGDELAAFANRCLVGKLVCIVPDADAHTKTGVMTQALLCRSRLRRLGAHAEIVLPPDDRLDQGIKGIDDYLGKAGGSLDGLVWYQKEPPSDTKLEEWLWRHPRKKKWTTPGISRAVETLQAIATHADENGDYSPSIRALGRAIGRRKRTPAADPDTSERNVKLAREAARVAFTRGIDDLLEIGAVSANKPLNVRVEKWLRTNRGWHKEGGFHWEEDDVVITLHEELRAPAERRSIQDLS